MKYKFFKNVLSKTLFWLSLVSFFDINFAARFFLSIESLNEQNEIVFVIFNNKYTATLQRN